MRTVPDSSPRTAIGNSMSSCVSTRSESESESESESDPSLGEGVPLCTLRQTLLPGQQ